nr:MAG TPA: hypothetical protein [Caudoviricetes sp.]
MLSYRITILAHRLSIYKMIEQNHSRYILKMI